MTATIDTITEASLNYALKCRIGVLGDAVYYFASDLFETVQNPALDPRDSLSNDDLRQLYVLTATIRELGASIEYLSEELGMPGIQTEDAA